MPNNRNGKLLRDHQEFDFFSALVGRGIPWLMTQWSTWIPAEKLNSDLNLFSAVTLNHRKTFWKEVLFRLKFLKDVHWWVNLLLNENLDWGANKSDDEKSNFPLLAQPFFPFYLSPLNFPFPFSSCRKKPWSSTNIGFSLLNLPEILRPV